jgi:universal stress protein A
MNYKKILFATDFSEPSEAAFQHATALARESGALLMIVHVQEVFISPAGEMLVVPGHLPSPQLRKMLNDVVPHDVTIRLEHHLVIGTPGEDIVRLADESNADLIVIGSHGRTGLTRLLMGSVAERVMRTAKCPVLIIKAAAAEPNGRVTLKHFEAVPDNLMLEQQNAN